MPDSLSPSSSKVDGTFSPTMTPSGEVAYHYTRIFKPTGLDGTRPLPPLTNNTSTMKGDRTDGLEYVYNEKIILAVNVAITTGRPLLVSGPPGSGKTSLARSVAKWQGWPYYEKVITSHTQARDLQWSFDGLRRLGDAQVAGRDAKAFHRLQNGAVYIEPGVLWWAFDRNSAILRGLAGEDPIPFPANDPVIDLGPQPRISSEIDNANPDLLNDVPPRAVVLLDEIDKADPDVPNDLLVPLGAMEFTVTETDTKVSLADGSPQPLIFITTNGERELPNAFLRRCLTLTLPEPTPQWLITIATRRFGAGNEALYQAIAEQILQTQIDSINQTPPGTAEFLDAVSACQILKVQPDPNNETWEAIRRSTLLKGRMPGGKV